MMGVCAVVPAMFLLALSFFVLVVIQKTEKYNLRVFGYVVTGLLWAAVLLVLSAGVYTFTSGYHGKARMGKISSGFRCPGGIPNDKTIWKMYPGMPMPESPEVLPADCPKMKSMHKK